MLCCADYASRELMKRRLCSSVSPIYSRRGSRIPDFLWHLQQRPRTVPRHEGRRAPEPRSPCTLRTRTHSNMFCVSNDDGDDGSTCPHGWPCNSAVASANSNGLLALLARIVCETVCRLQSTRSLKQCGRPSSDKCWLMPAPRLVRDRRWRPRLILQTRRQDMQVHSPSFEPQEAGAVLDSGC